MVQRFLPHIVAATCCIALGCARETAYRGDGVFKDLSGQAGPFIRGYSISMPEFDLGFAQNAEYHLSGLRNIGNHCGIYLAIIPRDGNIVKETKQFEGNLRFELIDSNGNSIVDVSDRLGNYTWAQGGNCELYQLDKSFFDPDSDEKYLLRLSYLPDSKLEGMRGFVYLRSGGSK